MRALKVVLGSALLAALFIACSHPKPDVQAAPFVLSDTMLARCKFHVVKKEKVREELRLFGKITADNSRLAQVYPVMGGSVLNINAELGDFVRQGQVLATVRSGDVAQLKKEKLDALSDLALAEKNLQVAKDLNAAKLNSEKDVRSAESELEKAKAEVDRISEVFNIYQLKGATTYNILSPIDGFVVAKDLNRNELLRNDKSDIVFSIAQIDEVWAVANVNESDISRVQVGYEAYIETIAYPGLIFKGKIDKVLNAIDPETKAMKAIVKINNADMKLKPEMNATIGVRYLDEEEMIVVPSDAIIFDKSKNWVMVYKGRDKIETRQIKIHNTAGDVTYISSGLSEGEKIISKNGLLIYDALND